MEQRWNAEDYAKNSAGQQRWAEELISELSLRGSESLIDIGCGDGKITARLAQILSRGSVLGIDSSPDMIRLAREMFPSTEHPNLSFLQMDAANIRLPRTFDIAFSNAALHWIDDPLAVLRGVHGCLKSGGKILFQLGGRGNANEVVRSIQEVTNRPQWHRHFEGFTPPYHFLGPEEYRTWLFQSGFRSVRVELIPKDMQHRGKEGFTGWVRTTWFPYTERLPAELRETFLKDVVDAYLEVHPVDPQGIVHVDMVRLEVEAFAL
jgi:trans-aconitate 2-methyltransferase